MILTPSEEPHGRYIMYGTSSLEDSYNYIKSTVLVINS